ncbi:hypothetical protein C9374_004071 [Naegleria lovaniensis]|uniref:Uncharacterized protein n=1 Tax=Naegleria lovaniensis TaxID=51637 RepID=A0AA88GSQ1_NAELO|nr:uncharacterized protein C9374_004071 [Naegleria lovaniensis]KAG2383400.1 hypothetical protein C9374_004071 [Naegleria lovaniensis]
MKDKLRRFNTADSPSYVLAPNFSHEQANVGTFNAPRQAASSSSYQETQIYSHTPPQQGVLTIAACENCSSQPSVLQQQNNLVASTGASLENDVRHDQLAQTETPRVGGSSPVLIASARSFKDMETYIHAKAAKPSLLDWNDLHNFDKDGFQIHNPSGNPYLMLTLVEITQNGGFQTVGALKLPLSKTCERTSFSNIFSNIPDLSFHNKNNIKIIAYFNGCDTPFLLRSQKHKDADNFIELKGSTTDVSKQNLNRLKTTAFGDVEDFRNLPSKPVFIPVLRLNVVQKKR